MSSTVAVLGIGTAWWLFGRSSVVVNTTVYKERHSRLYRALGQKLYFDAAYDAVFIRPFIALADLLFKFDRTAVDGVVNGAASGFVASTAVAQRFDKGVIDGAVNGIATLTRRVGQDLRSLQTGRLQSYQRLILAAVVLLMAYLVLKGA
jgi:NADH-quinone oxidoreductase subunit L